MVSKGKILGKHTLIFVTIGSTNFQFNRLFLAIDNVLSKLQKEIFLAVQKGNTTYKWRYKHITFCSYIKPVDLINFIKKADKIITHAGPATLYLITKHAKSMPFIVPRISQYGEHVDDHQLFFCEYLKTKIPKTASRYIITDHYLEQKLKIYLNNKTQSNILKRYLFRFNNKKRLIDRIDEFITDTVK